MNTKKQVKAVLDELPDDCTMEEVQYQLYVADLLRRRAEMSETSELIAHEDVVKRLAKWRIQSSSPSSGSRRPHRTSKKSGTT